MAALCMPEVEVEAHVHAFPFTTTHSSFLTMPEHFQSPAVTFSQPPTVVCHFTTNPNCSSPTLVTVKCFMG